MTPAKIWKRWAKGDRMEDSGATDRMGASTAVTHTEFEAEVQRLQTTNLNVIYLI